MKANLINCIMSDVFSIQYDKRINNRDKLLFQTANYG